MKTVTRAGLFGLLILASSTPAPARDLVVAQEGTALQARCFDQGDALANLPKGQKEKEVRKARCRLERSRSA